MSSECLDILRVFGYIAGYILICVITPSIMYLINYVKYFALAVVARMPITRYNVMDIDFITEGDHDCLLARMFWPMSIPIYVLYALWTFFSEFIDYASRSGGNTPKWLTVSGWVNYTNRLLGFKDQ